MRAYTREQHVAYIMHKNVSVELERASRCGLDTVAQSLTVALALIGLKMHPDDFAEWTAKHPQNGTDAQ